MSKRNDNILILDIKESLNRIIDYSKDIDFNDFKNDSKTQDAVIRNIEILGEATKLLSIEFKLRYSNIPWKSIAGTRDKLIHDYFGVNLDIIWNIAKNEIPKILEILE